MREYDFYIVPTPIGNLGDITLRAIEILKSADIIACEDSRNTQKLLNHFDIKTKCISYHKYNEKERLSYIEDNLKMGKKVALVSDAGTPLICDPGAIVVEELRNKGYKVSALPGANALITFLSQISRQDEEFTFLGFLPKTETKIQKIITENKYRDTVFYESPKRILQTLETIRQVRPNCRVAIGRELTKVFEEVFCSSISDAINHFKSNIIKGEFVCMIFRQTNKSEKSFLEEKVTILKSKGFSSKDIAVILSELYGVNKNDIYKMAK